MLVIYIIAMFISATLLFLVQPMFARMVLPLLGGSPAVWNTTVVFYQAMLLAGYIYAHVTTKRLGVRRQAGLHIVLLLLPLLVLPIGIPAGWRPPTTDNPIPWLLALLLVAVGLPFFVVSTSSPMLQKWFASTGHRAAADPYFLYAASNVGSMLALLNYPLLVEPSLHLDQQSTLWTAGYSLLVVVTIACAVIVWRTPASRTPAITSAPAQLDAPANDTPISNGQRIRWILLAFVPSSLMLSVTTYISNNIVPLPLLWIIPLVLYLLTFILVFARKSLIPHWLLIRAMPIVLLPLVIMMIAQATQPIALVASFHLIVFFIIAMVCHGEMARTRPSPNHLTEFYLWMSLGGMLGGMFNALLAPLIFTTVIEYPLVLVLAVLLQWHPSANPSATRSRWPEIAVPAGIGLIVAGLILAVQGVGLGSGNLGLGLLFGPPALFCFSFSRKPLRFGLAIAALFLASSLYVNDQGRILYAERSFYGTHRVLVDPLGRAHTLAHGGTNHGSQNLDPIHRDEPTSYFHPTGPLGQVFAEMKRRANPMRRVAVVGLGAGSVACYARPGEEWTFYELDPVVDKIARDPRFFTFLHDCAPNAKTVFGDGRLSLVAAPDHSYDMIVLDAFSSDAPPLHLLTREALALYRQKLAPNGVLAFNISNNFLNLKSVVGNLAQDAGLVALEQDDFNLSDQDKAVGKRQSQWAIMAPDPASFGALAADSRWTALAGDPARSVWTDNFSNILSTMRWR